MRTNVLRACQTLINYSFLGAINIIFFFAILLIIGLIKLISSNKNSNFIYRVYFSDNRKMLEFTNKTTNIKIS